MNEKPHLHIIPIVHTYADGGSLRSEISVDERLEAMITGYWVGIFHYLNSLPSDHFAHLQIYQDGLVDAPPAIVDRIVDETQTANYEILRWLRGKGTAIYGTEDPGLLMEEYQALKAIASYPDGEAKTAARLEYVKKSSWLLEQRDQYIARRVRETLPRGRMGLLFIGAAHDIGLFLTNEMRVSTPEVISRTLPEVLRGFHGLGREWE